MGNTQNFKKIRPAGPVCVYVCAAYLNVLLSTTVLVHCTAALLCPVQLFCCSFVACAPLVTMLDSCTPLSRSRPAYPAAVSAHARPT
jgi:hypothetical protein